MKRIALYGLIVLALLVGGVMLTVDSIARSAIETGVEAGLGVPADVGSVSLRLLMGSFRMDDLQIANADGYEADHFLVLGHTETAISWGDLRAGDVVLKRLLLSDLALDLEWKGSKANYAAILAGTGDSAASEPTPTPSASDGESQTRFIIDELVIQNVVATVRLDSAVGKLGEAEVKLPEMRLEAIGRKSGGVSMAQVVRLVTQEVLKEVMREGKGLGPEFSSKFGSGAEDLRGLSKGSTSDKIRKAGDLLRGLGRSDD